MSYINAIDRRNAPETHMTTAARIIAAHKSETFAQAEAMESECRDLAISTTAANCYDRVWTFYDGSTITKTRDGYVLDAAEVDEIAGTATRS